MEKRTWCENTDLAVHQRCDPYLVHPDGFGDLLECDAYIPCTLGEVTRVSMDELTLLSLGIQESLERSRELRVIHRFSSTSRENTIL